MSHNYDFTRADGTEVTVCYRLTGSGRHPDDPIEVEFEKKVYGLPEGEELTKQEWLEIETDILKNPPEPDYYFG